MGCCESTPRKPQGGRAVEQKPVEPPAAAGAAAEEPHQRSVPAADCETGGALSASGHHPEPPSSMGVDAESKGEKKPLTVEELLAQATMAVRGADEQHEREQDEDDETDDARHD